MNNSIQWISTTQDKPWQANTLTDRQPTTQDTLELTATKAQTIEGFGGCFNEMGWIALQKLDATDRERVMTELFDADSGCAFNFCRMPIGASDYAAEWYSHDEHDDDYDMAHFSIERDRQYLLPYINAAKRLVPDMKMFASPWSPPTWMKFPKAYNNGKLRMEPKVLQAYALYFKKFVEAYAAEGITIDQVHIQNEPFADQKFPSCLWTSEEFRVFIRDYIGPLFEQDNVPAEIWLGTLNGPTARAFGMFGLQLNSYSRYLDNILFDQEARKYIKGVGYQWDGGSVVQKTQQSFPELRLMQTENECGDGRNSWEYAHYMFTLLRQYIDNGVCSYTYWNMVLEPKGKSTWGWDQNAMITVDPQTRQATINPDFYAMKHYSRYVAQGAKLVKTTGHWTNSTSAFVNPDGSIVIVVNNELDRAREFNFYGEGRQFSAMLEPGSFNTFVLAKNMI